MKSKKWIFVLCNFLASFFLVACQSGSNGSQSAVEAIKQKGKLVVATSPDYAPFEFQSLVDGKNQVVGADIDMAQAIADELGVKLEISSMSFDNPNHSYLSQLDVTYKTPDLMSHFLPPHEISFTFCCSSIVFPR